jgi:hypothetical protein
MSEKEEKITEKGDPRVAIQEIKSLGDLGETVIIEISGVIKEMYKASKANPLMGIAAFLFTMDFLEKLHILYPNTAQAGREACFQAIGLTLTFGNAANFKAWEQAIPIIGFFTTSTNMQYESILKTSLTIDATGGETIVREALRQTGESSREDGGGISKALLKLLAAG